MLFLSLRVLRPARLALFHATRRFVLALGTQLKRLYPVEGLKVAEVIPRPPVFG